MKINRIILCGMLIIASACAKEKTTNTNFQTREYIEAWVSQNYPNAVKTQHGAYILEETDGNGMFYTGEKYAYVTYTLSNMNGKITETTDEKIAQQIGSYNKGDFYGPKVWYIAKDNQTVGMQDMLKGLRVGSKRKILLPGWLNTQTEYTDIDQYLEDTESTTDIAIYEITLESLVNNITLKQITDIQLYNKAHYGKIDSLSYGFYYKELKAPTDTNAFTSSNTFKINYIGRLLNGKVFDTTIKDTAKKYDIYNASAKYEPVEIRWGDSVEDVSMYDESTGETSTPIVGFQKLLWEMRRYGKSVGIFYSDLGYGDTGSGNKIPGYSPLLFEVEIVEITN